MYSILTFLVSIFLFVDISNANNCNNIKSCLIANNKNYGFTTDILPCLVKEKQGYYSCFREQTNGNCPSFTTLVCKQDPLIAACSPNSWCYRANEVDEIVLVNSTKPKMIPPCWIFENARVWSCFSTLNGKCPFQNRKQVFCPQFSG